ncbi:DNA-deoxyinosine glycosylase [Chitinolyticbacter albus]|uniref:DNA-deoxyinosine glycosylase n=1 Tax=Chitinolyticbacter albus TaxID=2961951 RepID=UPI002108873A|nr:DNA-deoxyinosine glycosylase [Chitinolyticbacter albus]
MTPHKSSFAAIANEHARILILGSLPGDASLAAGHYYAHPRNAFWAIMSQLLHETLLGSDWPQRYATLHAHGIALWDVVGTAQRRGSLDTALRDIAANPLARFVTTLPALRCIVFNGGTAARLGKKQLTHTGLPQLALPSTSPAHTLSFEAKLAAWSALGAYL